MKRWIHTVLTFEGAGSRNRPQLALVGADNGCSVCDHPFGHLTHACISAIGMAAPAAAPRLLDLPVANIA